jgi:putative redox protein
VAGNTAGVTMRWREQLVFEGGGEGRPSIVVDGDAAVATSPVELLLLAGATCTSADVVSILEKMRVGLRSLEVAMTGTRRAEPPAGLPPSISVQREWRGVDEAKVRRAVDLSLEKYCSVMASLATDIGVTYDVTIA